MLSACARDDVHPAAVGDDDSASCEGPAAPGSVCVERVRATVTDLAGAPLADRFVTLCGQSLCFSATSDARGVATFPVQTRLLPHAFALYGHAGEGYGGVVTPLDGLLRVIEQAEPLRLPTVHRGALALPLVGADEVLDLGAVRLTVPAGATFELEPADGEAPDGRRLGAARVDPALAPKALRDAGARVAVALAPFATRASMDLPYSILEVGIPGEKVQVVSLVCDFLGEPFAAGTVEIVDELVVAADGGVSGKGLRTLSWLGVR